MESPTSKVLSVTDGGIYFDTFNSSCEPVPCTICRVHKEMVAYGTESSSYIVNTETGSKKMFEIPDVKRIEFSPNGEHVAFQTKNQKIYVVKKNEIAHVVEDAVHFEISSTHLVYTQETDEKLVESIADGKSGGRSDEASRQRAAKQAAQGQAAAEAEKPAGKKLMWSKAQNREGDVEQKPLVVKKPRQKTLKVVSFEKMEDRDLKIPAPMSYVVTEKHIVGVRILRKTEGEIECIKTETGERLKRFGVYNMISATFLTDRRYGTENVLCLCSVSGDSGTYYDKKILYHIGLERMTFRLVDVESPVSDAVFLKREKFAVCHGKIPNRVTVFDKRLEKAEEMKRGTRNKMFFNRQENLVCFAGMNNLPGTMEIFEHPTNIFVSESEVIGCSVVEWSPCGNFYLVGVTNKMKVDNKVVLFDYYSRKIAEREFKELVDCRFLGRDMPFKGIDNPPEKIKIEKKLAYVPPSQRKPTEEPTCTWVAAHIIKSKDKIREKKIQGIMKELEEIEQIEKRMEKGQVVPGGIYKIQKKDALLKKLEHEQKDEK